MSVIAFFGRQRRVMIGGRSNLLEQHLHKKRVDPPRDLFEQQQQQQQQQQPSLCFIGL